MELFLFLKLGNHCGASDLGLKTPTLGPVFIQKNLEKKKMKENNILENIFFFVFERKKIVYISQPKKNKKKRLIFQKFNTIFP